jgi:CRISPR-associated protein Cas1
LLVTKEDEVMLAVPFTQVSEVVLMGGVGATTPAMLALLDQGAGLTLISSGGRIRGRLMAAEARNLPLRHKQYARSTDEKFCLAISRAIVIGKLKNCRTMARRVMRGRKSQAAKDQEPKAQNPNPQGQNGEGGGAGEHPEVARLNEAIKGALTAKDLAELRGQEGMGSKAYFSILKGALREEMSFEKRTRRPPKDPANALLSLAYTLLTNAIFTACEVAGLDAYDGFFHADKYGRPALALDLVEEFRPIVADSVVLKAVNNRMVGEEDFEYGEEGGVYLAGRSLKVFLAQFGKRLNTPVFHPDAGRALSYQKVFEIQARRLRKCIESGEPGYEPFVAK